MYIICSFSQYIKQLLVRNKGLGLFVPKERTIARK